MEENKFKLDSSKTGLLFVHHNSPLVLVLSLNRQALPLQEQVSEMRVILDVQILPV